MHIIEAIKETMSFGEKPVCETCGHSITHEDDANSPIVRTCRFAGNITFKVEDDDICLKWEEN